MYSMHESHSGGPGLFGVVYVVPVLCYCYNARGVHYNFHMSESTQYGSPQS